MFQKMLHKQWDAEALPMISFCQLVHFLICSFSTVFSFSHFSMFSISFSTLTFFIFCFSSVSVFFFCCHALSSFIFPTSSSGPGGWSFRYVRRLSSGAACTELRGEAHCFLQPFLRISIPSTSPCLHPAALSPSGDAILALRVEALVVLQSTQCCHGHHLSQGHCKKRRQINIEIP